jgi:endonuclease/exonuclease/phosphatase family metal-dependent hydrolase
VKGAAWALLFAAAACGGEDAVTPTPITLKVATINLRHDSDWWQDRFPLIADEIARLDPDLIGMQEIEIAIDQSAALLGLLESRTPTRYHLYQELKTGLLAISGEGIGILSRFPIEATAVHDLQYGRPAVFARVRAAADRSVDFYNTHLHHEGGDEVRRPQMEAVLDFIGATSGQNPAILTGDMNATDDSATIATAVAGGLIDSFRAVHGDRTAAIGATSPIVLAKTPVEQRPTRRIDYVFARPGGARIEVLGSTVAFTRTASSGLYPSDHLGVMTTLRLE